jgi:hypothetical protein
MNNTGQFLLLPPSLPLGDPELMERLAYRQVAVLRRLREEGPPSQWRDSPPADGRIVAGG